jgi:hypothetical protein
MLLEVLAVPAGAASVLAGTLVAGAKALVGLAKQIRDGAGSPSPADLPIPPSLELLCSEDQGGPTLLVIDRLDTNLDLLRLLHEVAASEALAELPLVVLGGLRGPSALEPAPANGTDRLEQWGPSVIEARTLVDGRLAVWRYLPPLDIPRIEAWLADRRKGAPGQGYLGDRRPRE